MLPDNVLSYDICKNHETVVGKNGKIILITWKGIAPWSRLYMFFMDGKLVMEHKTSAGSPCINTLERAAEILDWFST